MNPPTAVRALWWPSPVRAAALILLTLTACTASTASEATPLPEDSDIAVAIRPVHDEALAGTYPSFEITNSSPTDLGYNLCFDHLEVRKGSTWVEAPLAADVCPALLLTLPASTTITTSFHLARSLGDGVYRIRVSFSAVSSGVSGSYVKRSSSFLVWGNP